MTDSDPWDWGTVLARDGRVIPPSACEPYLGNKGNWRDDVGGKRDAPHADDLRGGGDDGKCACGGTTTTPPPRLCTWEMPHWGRGYCGGEQCDDCGFVWGLKDE